MRAALAGSALALVIDLLMLSAGHPSLWQPMGLLGSFYDAQGRALLHGHLSVPPASVSFEGFVIDGRTYMYFGPVPALLRLPVLLVTHGLDGRMTQLSMLLALVVLLVAGAGLHWRIRELLRPGAPVGRGERVAAFALAVALGTGSTAVSGQLGGRLPRGRAVGRRPRRWPRSRRSAGSSPGPRARRIAWAGLLALLAVNTRVAVGHRADPRAGRWLDRGGGGCSPRRRDAAWRWARARPRALGRPVRRRVVAYLTLAAVLALGSAVALNEAKFHSAFGLPLAQQVDTQIDPNQRAYVAANHGALLGLKFVPTDAAGGGASGRARAGAGVSVHRPARLPADGDRRRALQRAAAVAERVHLDAAVLPAAAGRTARAGSPPRVRGPLIGLLAATGAGVRPRAGLRLDRDPLSGRSAARSCGSAPAPGFQALLGR